MKYKSLVALLLFTSCNNPQFKQLAHEAAVAEEAIEKDESIASQKAPQTMPGIK